MFCVRRTTHTGPGLLLLCAVIFEAWFCADAKPMDFVCNRGSRTTMNSVIEMGAALSVCDGLVALSLPVQLPCIKVNKESWEGKSHQEKRGDIIASLGLLIKDVTAARALGQPGCASSLLQRLEHSANNYLHILTHLELNGTAESPRLSCVPRSSQSLATVVRTYSRLITGKLEWLMDTLEATCTHPL